MNQGDDFLRHADKAGGSLTATPSSRRRTVSCHQSSGSGRAQRLAGALREHGAKSDLMESRAAFAEKRRPDFKGWDDPKDRYRLPSLDTVGH